MLPTAGLFLPETLHRNPPSTSGEDSRRAKRKATSRKSFDRPSTARSSVDDASTVFTSLSTVFKFATFVASLNEVSSEVEVFVNLIHRVWQDVTEASRLATCDAVTEYYAPFPARKAWIDDTVLDVRRALNDIGVYMENVRVGGHDGGTVKMKHRFEWVLSHHQKLLSRELALLTYHQSLTAAIMTMQAVEMGRDSMPQVFEAPAQPWIKTAEREIMRSPHNRQKWRKNQRNQSLPSIAVSDVEDHIKAQAINTVPSELPGSNPLDLADPENWDLYEPPPRPSVSPPKLARGSPNNSTSTPKPPATHSNTFPLAIVDERPLVSQDEPDAFAKQRSIKLARRYRPRAVEVRKGIGKHHSLPSLPSELPCLPRHSSLISELSNWVLPNADFEHHVGNEDRHISSGFPKMCQDLDSPSSSIASPNTPSSTVSCPEPLRIRKSVSSLHSTPPTASTSEVVVHKEQTNEKPIARETTVDGSSPTAVEETPAVGDSAPRMSSDRTAVDRSEKTPKLAPPPPSNKASDDESQKDSHNNHTTILNKITPTNSPTNSPTSDSTTTSDLAISSSHASQSSQSPISSVVSTALSKMKYSLFPAQNVVDTTPDESQPPFATMAMMSGSSVDTQAGISPQTALSSHLPPSPPRETVIRASPDPVQQTTEAPISSSTETPAPEAVENLSPTDHDHYVSVCYSPKGKRKPNLPPPPSAQTSTSTQYPVPDRPLPSPPSETQQTLQRPMPIPVIMLHSPKFPAHKQPWLPLDTPTQLETKGVNIGSVPKDDTEVQVAVLNAEIAVPGNKFPVSEGATEGKSSVDKNLVRASSPTPESTKGSGRSTLASTSAFPKMPLIPASPGAENMPLVIAITEAIKSDVKEAPEPPAPSGAESPRPMSAQAKRRRAQARRLQMAYGSG